MNYVAIRNSNFGTAIDDVCRKLAEAQAAIEHMRHVQMRTFDPNMTEQGVRQIIRARRDRCKFFNSQLFADPAWDMLLELYAARLGDKLVSVSSLCLAAAVPATTALRWIGILSKEGLIERADDTTDGRRVFVSLSDAGRNAMAAYFRATSSANSL